MMSGRVLESISARSFSFSSGFSGAFCLAVSFAVLELSCYVNVGDAHLLDEVDFAVVFAETRADELVVF